MSILRGEHVFGFCALRKGGLSTWHRKPGHNPKDAQAILRHEEEETTLRHYTMTDYEDQIAAVDRFEEYFLNSERRHYRQRPRLARRIVADACHEPSSRLFRLLGARLAHYIFHCS